MAEGARLPRRGEVVRQLGNALREKKEDLGALVTLEMGKIIAEGEGEVQEMIDICDFAVGLSRQLYGLTMHVRAAGPPHAGAVASPGRRGGDHAPSTSRWPSGLERGPGCGLRRHAPSGSRPRKTPLTAIAVTKIAAEVCRANDVDPAIFSLVVGKGSTVGDRLLHDRRIPLVSATGSCEVGRRVAEVVGERLAGTILELGGNNAIIVTPSANMDLVLPAILFGAVGTAGQRCTSTRRIIVHASMKEELLRPPDSGLRVHPHRRSRWTGTRSWGRW